MDAVFICLANSRKLSGRCVAGLRTDGGGWIRPVSHEESGTLWPRHYTLNDGREARLLDVIEVVVTSPRPEPHQPENWVLGERRWRLVRRLEPATAWKAGVLGEFLAPGPYLLGNRTDRLDYSTLLESPARSSLALIEPAGVSWDIIGQFGGRRQTRARFQLSGVTYNLSVTDPNWEQRLSELSYGIHPRAAAGISQQDRLLFTVSLGEPFKGECYKLVAAVLVLPQ